MDWILVVLDWIRLGCVWSGLGWIRLSWFGFGEVRLG